MFNSAKKLLEKFRQDQRGVALTEFALVGPVLVALLIFSVNGFDAYRGLRKASATVDMIGDLATRDVDFSSSDRDQYFAAAEAILDKYAVGNNVEMIISSVEQDADGNYIVLWSVANDNATAHGAALPADVENDLPGIPVGESIIVTELDFQFQPTFQDLWVGSIAVDQFSISRPRKVAQITYVP